MGDTRVLLHGFHPARRDTASRTIRAQRRPDSDAGKLDRHRRALGLSSRFLHGQGRRLADRVLRRVAPQAGFAKVAYRDGDGCTLSARPIH